MREKTSVGKLINYSAIVRDIPDTATVTEKKRKTHDDG